MSTTVYYVLTFFVLKIINFGLIKSILAIVVYFFVSLLMGYYLDKRAHKESHQR